ncbi:MAG: hypothetical protein NTV46_15445 [Verrucomicrobia bacterium]|nr:hypothetical protein [Verrucomicrobiota bacterium]
MKTLELNPQEQELLVRILERCQADLDHEIHHTDHREFRGMLSQRQLVIAGIIQKLQP